MSTLITIGKKEYFPKIKKISYKGLDSKDPLSFKYYDADKIIAGKPMKEHFRFATAYWHTFCGTGGDPFGPGTKSLPWDSSNDPIKNAHNRLDAAFEFLEKHADVWTKWVSPDVAKKVKASL